MYRILPYDEQGDRHPSDFLLMHLNTEDRIHVNTPTL